MQRPLLLNGFMGTGKTTVGRLVAERTSRRFVDLDQEIERQAGMSIAQLFSTQGESAFRRVERAALLAVLDASDAPVVALGGGALLRREARLAAIDHAVVVTLTASADTIHKRAAAEAGKRPLLSDAHPHERISDLLELRAPAYAEAHAVVNTDGESAEQLAAQLQAIWVRDPLGVAAGAQSYAVDIGANILEQRVAPALAGASRVLLVSDRTVFDLYGQRMQAAIESSQVAHTPIVVEPGEAHKTPGTLTSIWQQTLAAGADRKSRFVGFGGGVVTDTAGFAAATFMRGVPWLSVPTTLLSMVDASVGGKTAVDLPGAKNVVGAFWQPAAVVCDTNTLSSESPRGYRSALAEVVKTAIIGDPALLDVLEARAEQAGPEDAELNTELVRRSIRVKARVVSEDEREGGFRAALNLGHTVGHAIESAAGYGELAHGEAVSLGLVAALRIGEALGTTPAPLTRRITTLLDRIGLPTDLSQQPLEAAIKLLAHDKKRAGAGVRFVLAQDTGSIQFRRLSLDELSDLVRALA